MKAIETHELHYQFQDGTLALKGINFQAEKGERIILLGANGAGKSTLFKCQNGIYTPTKGEVYVEEEKVTKSNLEKIRQKANQYLWLTRLREDTKEWFDNANVVIYTRKKQYLGGKI